MTTPIHIWQHQKALRPLHTYPEYRRTVTRHTVGFKNAEQKRFVVPFVLEFSAIGKDSDVHLVGNFRPRLSRLMPQGRPGRVMHDFIPWELLNVALYADKMRHVQHPLCKWKNDDRNKQRFDKNAKDIQDDDDWPVCAAFATASNYQIIWLYPIVKISPCVVVEKSWLYKC